jgi:hypothetical protein
MAATAHTVADMGRPKSEKPKEAVISLRTFAEVRAAIEDYAAQEHRTIAQMTELLLREAIISRRRKDKRSASDIEDLP